MQMDINDFGNHQEMFGFSNDGLFQGRNRYQQMSHSNTNFLNFTLDKDKRAAKKDIDALKADYYKRIDALPASATAQRDALFAELEQKMKERGAQLEEIQEAQQAKRKSEQGEKISSGVSTALDIFRKTTEAFGIGKRLEGENVGGQNQGQQVETRSQIPTWVWIAGGAVVLGLGVFAIYKFRK
jgi:acyl-CoA reductase-like NAD-dependent aldehyde dehydrogenase